MSAFVLEDGVVYHTYSTYARGLDGLWGMYQWLDRAPKGRNETGVWWRRHDEYDQPRPAEVASLSRPEPMPQAARRSAMTSAPRRKTAGASTEGGKAVAFGAAEFLCLAAAPTFATMALLTAVLGGGPADMLCSSLQPASRLSGMVPMYLLMSAFHLAPWLKLVSGR